MGSDPRARLRAFITAPLPENDDELWSGLAGFVLEAIEDTSSVDGQEMTDHECVRAIHELCELYAEALRVHDEREAVVG